MAHRENVLGNVYGKLTVIDENENISYGRNRKVLCECKCGDKIMVRCSNLKSGITKSCGCIKKTKIPNKDKLLNHPLFSVLKGMKGRCSSLKHHRYGGRGIKVCDEWRGVGGTKAFIEWALENGYEKGLQIDRIDNDGNYEPSNCRFVTCQENNVNKELTKTKYGYQGVYKTNTSKSYFYQFVNNGNKYYEGGFETALDAAIGRDERIVAGELNNKLQFEDKLEYYISIKDEIKKRVYEKENLYKHPLYKKYLKIKKRIYEDKEKYSMYDEWMKDYKVFYRWCMKNGYDKELRFVRLDYNLGWKPSNCAFMSKEDHLEYMREYNKKNKVF